MKTLDIFNSSDIEGPKAAKGENRVSLDRIISQTKWITRIYVCIQVY